MLGISRGGVVLGGAVAAIKKASTAGQKLVDGVGLGAQGSRVVFAVASFRFLLLLAFFSVRGGMCVLPQKCDQRELTKKAHTFLNIKGGKWRRKVVLHRAKNVIRNVYLERPISVAFFSIFLLILALVYGPVYMYFVYPVMGELTSGREFNNIENIQYKKISAHL